MENNAYFEKIRHGGMMVVFFGLLFIFFWSVFIVAADRIHLIIATSVYFLMNHIVSPIMIIWLLISAGWLIFLITALLIYRIAQILKNKVPPNERDFLFFK